MFTNQQTPDTQQGQGMRLQDADLANIVLAELKRTAEEYTTAFLEAQNAQIRHVFQNLLMKTLNDQARLFDSMRSLNLYEAPTPAQPQEVQKAVQSKQQEWGKLQTLTQQLMNQRHVQAAHGGQQFFA
jgi:spore coat protein CotF